MLNKLLLGLIIIFEILIISTQLYGMSELLLNISAITLILVIAVTNIILLSKLFEKISEKLEKNS